ncbi:MAG: SDR family NAD(P)-dependent oxidoreductase [Candidatus Dormibacteria bacterium]
MTAAVRVLITGGAGAIGSATNAALRARGCGVAALDVAAAPDVIACDVRDQASVDAAVNAAVERLGGLDVLINNAGLGTPTSSGSRPGDSGEAVVDVNLLGPWRVTAAALPHLLSSRGRVVNVASGLAHLGVPFGAAYCMSKRGLIAFSDSLRAEYGDRITVTTVYPGYIRTPIHNASVAAGVALEGVVPAESLEDAVRALVRAATGRPARDLATTRRGAFSYALLRYAPRRAVDGVLHRALVRHVRSGRFAGSAIASELVERLRAAP